MNDLQHKLRAAFQAESRDHLAILRRFFEQIAEFGDCDRLELEEVFRRAHSLKGAARTVGLGEVEQLAHQLETLFSRMREGKLALQGETLQQLGRLLDDIEDRIPVPAEAETPPGTRGGASAAEKGEEEKQGGAAAPDLSGPAPESSSLVPPARSRGPELVRVATENLDRILASAGEVMAHALRQDQLRVRMDRLLRQIQGLEQAWEGTRNQVRAAEASLSRRGADGIQDQIRGLSRTIREIRLEQRQSSWTLARLSQQLEEDVRRARTVPAENVFEGFRKMVRDLARESGRQVDFHLRGLEVEADRMVLQALKDPVMHLLRNAVIHGVDTPEERRKQGKPPAGRVELSLATQGQRLSVEVRDDGRGVDPEEVLPSARAKGLALPPGETGPARWTRILFEPGFSTSPSVTALAGRGMGLSVAQQVVLQLQGEIELVTEKNRGTQVRLSVPLSVVLTSLVLVSSAGQTFALPSHGIESLQRVPFTSLRSVEGRPVMGINGSTVPITVLAHLLGRGDAEVQTSGSHLLALLLKSGERRLGVAVDAVLGERSGTIKPIRIPGNGNGKISGGVLLEDGSVALVLHPGNLVESFYRTPSAPAVRRAESPPEKRVPKILVVDDSFTTRTLEKSLLEAHGYQVEVAVDGLEALEQLRRGAIDLIIADIQMPRMDGFALLQALKQEPEFSSIPVILVTSMESREDQERGLALGADAYIVKRKFDQKELLETIEQYL